MEETPLCRRAFDVLRSRPTSVVIIGAERIPRDRLAAAIARALDPTFLWFELARPGDEVTPAERELFRQNEPDRFLEIDPDDFRLREDLGTLALWAAGRDEHASEPLREVAEFAILPDSIRLALLSRDPDGGRGAIVVANAERARGNFDGRPGSLRPYVEVLNRFGFTPIITAWEQFRENATDLEYILRIAPDSAAPADGLVVRCVRGGPTGTFGFLAKGSRFPLHSFLEEVAPSPPAEPIDRGGSDGDAQMHLAQFLR